MSKAYIKRDLAVGKYYADVEGGGSGSGGASYSETESLTGGTWIDGSPIYTKTIDFGALPNATEKIVAHGISDIDTIISIAGIAINPTTHIYLPLPSVSKTAVAENIAFSANLTNVGVNTGTNYSSLYTQTYITLTYTKTT